MYDVALPEARVNSAQKRMHKRFEMFGADGGQTNDSNAVVLCNIRREICAAVCSHDVPFLGQAAADLLATSFHSAVFANNSPPTEQSDAQ